MADPVTQASASRSTLPDWYTQYGQSLTGAGLSQLANTQSYQGAVDALGNPIPRVAGLSGQQQQAASQVAGNQGNYFQGLDTGGNVLGSGVQSALGAGQYYDSANNTVSGGLDTIGRAQDTMMGAARPLANAESTLGDASSFLDPARASINAGGSTFDQQQMQSYMNPYVNNVVDRIATLGNRNLNENVLPGVNSTFTGAGQFGSSRNADFTNRAIRDSQEAISGAQGTALMTAQKQANDDYAAEKQRQLAAGSQLGGLAQIGTGIASGYNNEANTTSNLGSALAGTGVQQFQGAGQYSNIGNNQVQQGQALGNLGMNFADLGGKEQQMGINDVNALLTTGGLDQNVQQKGLDSAYQDFIDQRDYPLTSLGALSQILPNVSGRVAPNNQTVSVSQNPTTDPTVDLVSLINMINSGSS